MRHILYTTNDLDSPNTIKDRNGEVVLDLCKVCGRGESDLDLDDKICPGAPPNSQFDTYQSRVDGWIRHCFGAKIGSDKVERNHRFLEEALETVQAGGCTLDEAISLALYVYGRPVGDLSQEIGGVMNTLAALCTAHGVDLSQAAEAELVRVWGKSDQIREKQKAKPKFSPLPG